MKSVDIKKIHWKLSPKKKKSLQELQINKTKVLREKTRFKTRNISQA